MAAVPYTDLPAGVAIAMVQNSDGTWPDRRSSRTDLYGLWVKRVVGSADPAEATSPAVNGSYDTDGIFGV